jgi:hypothetical protein
MDKKARTKKKKESKNKKSRWRRDFPHPSRAALGSTQPPIMGTESLSKESSGWGVALTTHPHLVPRLKKE